MFKVNIFTRWFVGSRLLAGDGPFDDNRREGKGRAEPPADEVVPLPGTVRLAEGDSL